MDMEKLLKNTAIAVALMNRVVIKGEIMNDYIPSTAEVRDGYSSESSDSKFANRSFDLWLAKYKAKTIAKAEDRIIKLLETYAEETGMYPLVRDELIALIKGETE